MATGNVYVFNVYGESMELNLNGMRAGTIPGWRQPGFNAQSLGVGRVLNASESPGHFFNGNNQVVYSYPSGLFFCSLRIESDTFPLNQDLILYLSLNKWVLYNSYGVLVEEGTVQPDGAIR